MLTFLSLSIPLFNYRGVVGVGGQVKKISLIRVGSPEKMNEEVKKYFWLESRVDEELEGMGEAREEQEAIRAKRAKIKEIEDQITCVKMSLGWKIILSLSLS